MSRAMAFSRFHLPALAVAALLGWPVASHAYRMLEGPNSGRTDGPQSAVACNNDVGFAHWNVRNISWYLNPANQGSGKSSRLQAALATWSSPNVPGTSYSLSYSGTTSAGVARDYRNTFVWGTTSAADLCDTTPCHAITVLQLDAGRVIRNVDIVFNNDMDWKTDDSVTSVCSTMYAGMPLDTQAIATHELGHSLGIHHPQGSSTVEPFKSATMGAQSCNVDGRSLATRDAYVDLWNFVDPDSGGPLVKVLTTSPANGHAFSLSTPSDYKSGKWTSVIAKFSATSANLSSSPIAVACNVLLFTSTPDASDYASNGGTLREVAVQFSASHSGRIRSSGITSHPESSARARSACGVTPARSSPPPASARLPMASQV
jgi:hypothetical protein